MIYIGGPIPERVKFRLPFHTKGNLPNHRAAIHPVPMDYCRDRVNFNFFGHSYTAPLINTNARFHTKLHIPV